MNCNEARAWLNGYVDGELDLQQTIAMEQHLEECGRCSSVRDGQQMLSRSIRAAGLTYGCPENLRSRVRALVRPDVAPRGAVTHVPLSWLVIAASLLLLVSAAWLGQGLVGGLASRQVIAQEVVACHVRSLLAEHLTDVASSDRHQVKPWFAGKLDFAPGVIDLSPEGFPLVGGRLDYLEHRSVAAVVYRRRQHVINLFIWPAGQSNSGPRSETINGYQLVSWNQAGAAHYAISDLNGSEMNEFAELIRNTVVQRADSAP